MPLSQELITKAQNILQEWSNEATAEMQRLLNERLKKNQYESALSQSINFEGTDATAEGAVATWSLDDYYIFVDLGVKGVNNKSKTYTSDDYPAGFQFKNLGTPPQMIDAMKNYISRKGIPLQDLQGNKMTIEQKAFQMSKAVKSKGTDGTRFYSDVFNDKGFKRLTDKLERSIGGEFEVKIIAQLKE